MGEVYRGSDLRLECSVAIKVWPAHHPVTASLRARFEREAKSISALQHPKPPFQTVVFFPGDGGIFLGTLSLPATSSLDAVLRSGRAVLHPAYKGTVGSGRDFGIQEVSRTYSIRTSWHCRKRWMK